MVERERERERLMSYYSKLLSVDGWMDGWMNEWLDGFMLTY